MRIPTTHGFFRANCAGKGNGRLSRPCLPQSYRQDDVIIGVSSLRDKILTFHGVVEWQLHRIL